MKNVYLGFVLFLILTESCTKSHTNSNYNYSVNTTDPSALPLGTLVADIDGSTTYFDSALSTNISYSQISTDTEYFIGITGFNRQSPQTYRSFVIVLRGWLPFDTASFYNSNLNGQYLNLYQFGYNTYTGGLLNAYSIGNGTELLYQAKVTHVDSSSIQGIFSGYLAPYNITNGAFNLITHIPNSYIK